jgi:CubicO group peptidase (beta-lactamase class C family)
MAAFPCAGQTMPELTAAAANLTRMLGADGAGLAVVRSGSILHRSLHGGFQDDQVMPLGAASEWLTVATVLAVADAGLLDLDVPASRYLPELANTDKRDLTLRQCLSCTAGFQEGITGIDREGVTLEQMARRIADSGQRSEPGTEFHHSELGFQLAACAAVRVTGKNWHQLFTTYIAAPLGLRNTAFGRLRPAGAEAGQTVSPWVATGALSTLKDYATFVAMLANQGTTGGRRVLSAKAVGDMFADSDRSGRLRVATDLFGDRKLRYGLGTWIEYWNRDGRAQRGTSASAQGFTAWVDTDLGLGGVFAVRARHVQRDLPPLQSLVRDLCAALPAATVPPVPPGR